VGVIVLGDASRASGLCDMFEDDDAALGRLQDPTSASYSSQDLLDCIVFSLSTIVL